MQFALSVFDDVRWNGDAVIGNRPRTLLRVLVHAGESGCSAETLIEEVWGEEPPANPGKALQVLVSRVRKATEQRVIERTDTGYRLGLTRTEVDAFAQHDLGMAAKQAYDDGEYTVAVRTAQDALDIAGSDEVAVVLALASSKSGDHTRALPLLEACSVGHPTDEDILAALLCSEAAVRGPGTALERYEQYRAGLAERLGSDPGTALQEAYRTILAADRPVREGVRYDATALLGRDEDLRRLHDLIGTSRVVSIVGAGGLGKTRLAHALSRTVEQPVVWFVELVSVISGEDVVGEVGSVLGVRDSISGQRRLNAEQRADVRSRIAQHLDAAPTLLVLDNCEQVIDAVADLVAFLTATTRDTRFLTTSRAPLEIAAERVYSLGELDTADAAHLFEQRASAARSNVVLDSHTITEIVTRLDGVPLAIELAAAKVRVMSVADIAQRLEDRFALLRRSDRSAPDRHRTLLAVIDWSWKLLTARQQQALSWLSVFHDSFAIEAAESVLGHTALEDVEALVRQSLLTVAEDVDGVRYRMLESVREFSRMRLVESGEECAAIEAQRTWARSYANARLIDVMGRAQFAAVDALRIEEANLADVLRQAVGDSDPDTVIDLSAVLGLYWTILGEHSRIIRLAPAVNNAVDGWFPAPEQHDNARVALAVLLTNARISSSQPPEGLGRLLERLGSDSDEPAVAATARVTLALIGVCSVDDLDRFCVADDRQLARQALQFRSHSRENDGSIELAIQDASQSLALTGQDDGPWTQAVMRMQLAQLHGQLGEHDAAADYAQLARPVFDRLDAVHDAIQCRVLIGARAIVHGRYVEAGEAFNELERTEKARPALGHPPVSAIGRAELALARGAYDEGFRLYRFGIERSRAMRFPWYGESDGLEPWTLFAESAALAAYAQYAGRDAGGDLWELLGNKAVAAIDAGRSDLDFPVAGQMLYSLGIWGLLRDAVPPREATHLLVLADRFAYSRLLPSMQWANAAIPAERITPGSLGDLQRAYGNRRGRRVIDDAQRLIAELFG